MHFEWTMTAGDLLKCVIFGAGFLGIYTKLVLTTGEIKNILTNFPPHRHHNGTIFYPDGYQPPPVGILKGSN